MTKEVKVLLGIGVASVLLVIGAVALLSRPSQPQTTAPADPNLLVREDSIKIASDSAKVTIVEFSDYQCPACRAAHPTIKQVLNDYQGRVNFVYRHFPLSQHKNAIPAALAAEAAGRQDKYWQMHDKIFETQDDWKDRSGKEIFAGFAGELGLDMDKYNRDIEDRVLKDKINKDFQDGVALGVNSTPTFFINGQKFPGALSYTEFKSRIDSELSK